MKNIQTFLVTLMLSGVLLAQAQPVKADNGVYGQYGEYGSYGSKGINPGQSIIIDKLVAQPGTLNKGGELSATYVDNLSVSGTKYQPNEMVAFMIKVKNVSGQKMTNITVHDIIPAYMEPMVGPGSYDKNTRTITYTIKELAPNAEDIQYVKFQIYPQDKLPADQTIVKFVNKVDVQVGQATDQDTSQLFAQKQVIGVSEVPKTGPALGLAFLALQVSGLGIGLFLRNIKK